MKKSLFSLAASALLIAATSCSQEEPVSPAPDQSGIPSVSGGGELVTLTVQGELPAGIRSRAAAPVITPDAMTHLYCGVYTTEGELATSLKLSNSELQSHISGGLFNIKIKLMKGVDYVLHFWADNYDSEVVDLNAKTVTLPEYAITMGGTSYKYHAFYGKTTVNLSTESTISATLRRPYAEVAVVSNMTGTEYYNHPYANYGVEKVSAIKINGPTVTLPNSWNFWDDTILEPELAGDLGFSFNRKNATEMGDLLDLVDDCKTLLMRAVLTGTKSYTLSNPKIVFHNSRSNNQLPTMEEPDVDHPFSISVPTIELKPNCRYIYVDKGEEGTGGGDGGSIFTTEVTINASIKSEIDNVEDDEFKLM